MGDNRIRKAVTMTAGAAGTGLLVSSFALFIQNLTRRSPDPNELDKMNQDEKKLYVLRKRSKEWIRRQKTETLTIESDDGLKLNATFLHNPNNGGDSRRIVLFSHGYGGRSIWDMGIFARYYYDKGFDMLFPDQRAHGKSEGRYITMGAWESVDLSTWADWICGRCTKDCRILVHGWSMGAAAAYLSAKYMPEQVKGIVFDCGYASAPDQFSYVGKMFFPKIPNPVIRAIVLSMNIWTRVITGFYLNEASPIKDAEDFDLPIFFVHGSEDRFVPCGSGMRLYAETKAPYKDKLVVPGAGHIMSWLYDSYDYMAGIDRLIQNCMPE